MMNHSLEFQQTVVIESLFLIFIFFVSLFEIVCGKTTVKVNNFYLHAKLTIKIKIRNTVLCTLYCTDSITTVLIHYSLQSTVYRIQSRYRVVHVQYDEVSV
jgi:hypothetical protein